MRSHTPKIRSVVFATSAPRFIDGYRIEICGLEFFLATSPRPLAAYSANRRKVDYELLRRPGSLRFLRSDGGVAEILISWNDGTDHPGIDYRIAGELDSE